MWLRGLVASNLLFLSVTVSGIALHSLVFRLLAAVKASFTGSLSALSSLCSIGLQFWKCAISNLTILIWTALFQS